MLGRVLIEADDPHPAALEMPGAAAWARARRGPEKQRGNEDAAGAWACGDETHVLAVADGLGGAPAGARASGIAVRTLDRVLAGADAKGGLRAPILDAFEQAHRAILDLGVGAGTTLAVVEIVGRTLRTYHVGDSAVLVVGQRGRLRLETLPHTPVGYGVAAGLIAPEEALDHADRHFVTNCLGQSDMHIQIGSPLQLGRHDTVLVASDGVFDNLEMDELAQLIRKGPIEEAARSLAETVDRRMRGDDSEAPCKPDDSCFLLYRAAPETRH